MIAAGHDPKDFLGGNARSATLKHYGDTNRLSEQNIARLRGDEYWEAVGTVYTRVFEALQHAGRFIVVIKPVQKKGEVIDLPLKTLRNSGKDRVRTRVRREVLHQDPEHMEKLRLQTKIRNCADPPRMGDSGEEGKIITLSKTVQVKSAPRRKTDSSPAEMRLQGRKFVVRLRQDLLE